jgi:hypothetical protein
MSENESFHVEAHFENYADHLSTNEDEPAVEERKGSGAAPNNFNPNFYNPFEIKHRRRTSRAQFKVLEQAFVDNPKPSGRIRQGLAQELAMSPRGVQVWFQNRRAKAKQQHQQQQKRKKQGTTDNHKQQQNESYDGHNNSTNSRLSSPYTLSASDSSVAHSRSQSSDSTCSTFEPLSDAYWTYHADDKSTLQVTQNPACFRSHQGLDKSEINPQIQGQLQCCSDTSTTTGDDEDTQLVSPLTQQLQTPPHNNTCVSPENDWWIGENDIAAAIMNQQVFLNHPVTSANTIHSTAKTTHYNNINDSRTDDHLNAWAYIDSLQIQSGANPFMTNSDQSTTSMIGHATNRRVATRSLGLGYNRNITDWVQTVPTQAAMDNEENLLTMLDDPLCYQQQDVSKSDTRRHSFPPIPLQQDAAYWDGQQVT